MANLSKANKVRQQKALDKIYNFSSGVSTYRKLINSFKFVKSEEMEVPKYKYNRVKYNQMNSFEQKEYDEKLKQKKTVYCLYYEDGYYIEVPKMVYEYYQNWYDENHCVECNKVMDSMEHNYGTDDFLCCIHCYNDAKINDTNNVFDVMKKNKELSDMDNISPLDYGINQSY